MTQPPTSGRGPGEEPARDLRLAAFAEGGAGDTCPPGPELAATIAELSGPEWRCAGATDEELIGLLGRWDALGSWVEAGRLGVVRELLRRRARRAWAVARPCTVTCPTGGRRAPNTRSAPRWR